MMVVLLVFRRGARCAFCRGPEAGIANPEQKHERLQSTYRFENTSWESALGVGVANGTARATGLVQGLG